MSSGTIYYVHDPMCSWCWGYRPVLDRLKSGLPESIEWKNLLGGLAPDSDVPMPEETRRMIMNHWRNIQAQLGTQFNFDFWTKCKPRRSTYPACRAVLAAAKQGAEEAMIDAIQRAYYLKAMNPSDTETLVHLADELGLEVERFGNDLKSPDTQQKLLDEINLTRTMGVTGFPSLVLQSGQRTFHIPVDYKSESRTLKSISQAIQPSAN